MNDTMLFPALPDEARLWVYVADRSLPADEQAQLVAHLEKFMQDWTSHGRPVEGAVAVLHDRFVVLAATLADGDISGCGIDASVHAVDAAAQALDVAWIPALHVVYRDAEGRVQHDTRSAFRAQVEAGAVTAETSVFDPSITTLGALRGGQFERPAGSSWHARAFDLAQPA